MDGILGGLRHSSRVLTWDSAQGLMTRCVLGDHHPDIILLLFMWPALLLLLLLVSVGAGHLCCSPVVVICPAITQSHPFQV